MDPKLYGKIVNILQKLEKDVKKLTNLPTLD
jgi:hypothetical protein